MNDMPSTSREAWGRLPDGREAELVTLRAGAFAAAILTYGARIQALHAPDREGRIADVALGFIAFSIGNEFRLSQLKETGKQALVVGILQAVTATVLVDIALLIFHFIRPDVLTVPAAITLGAIAAATAPAATLMVVRQYKAKGPLLTFCCR